MKITNRQADAHPSSISLHDFGRAMSALDLDGLTPPQRRAAVRDHLARIMGDTILDADTAYQVRVSRALMAKRNSR